MIRNELISDDYDTKHFQYEGDNQKGNSVLTIVNFCKRLMKFVIDYLLVNL